MLAQVYNNKVPIRHSCSYLESQYLKILYPFTEHGYHYEMGKKRSECAQSFEQLGKYFNKSQLQLPK